jgi:hypothetical protein
MTNTSSYHFRKNYYFIYTQCYFYENDSLSIIIIIIITTIIIRIVFFVVTIIIIIIILNITSGSSYSPLMKVNHIATYLHQISTAQLEPMPLLWIVLINHI